jgi:hypothetical protein
MQTTYNAVTILSILCVIIIILAIWFDTQLYIPFLKTMDHQIKIPEYPSWVSIYICALATCSILIYKFIAIRPFI